MSWKQPIPTDLHLVFGEDYEANLLYRELLYRASNEERIVPIDGFRIHIKRGETLFSRSSFGKFLSWDKHKCARVLQSLQEFYKKVSRRTTGKYTLVQMLNYDEVIKFEQEDDRRQDRRQDTPKSDKIDKSEKKEEETPPRPLREKKENKDKEEHLAKLEAEKVKHAIDPDIEEAIETFRDHRDSIGIRLTALSEVALRKSIWKALEKDNWSFQDVLSSIQKSIAAGYRGVFFDAKPFIPHQLHNESTHTTQRIQFTPKEPAHSRNYKHVQGKKSSELTNNPWVLAKQEALRSLKQIP